MERSDSQRFFEKNDYKKIELSPKTTYERPTVTLIQHRLDNNVSKCKATKAICLRSPLFLS